MITMIVMIVIIVIVIIILPKIIIVIIIKATIINNHNNKTMKIPNKLLTLYSLLNYYPKRRNKQGYNDSTFSDTLKISELEYFVYKFLLKIITENSQENVFKNLRKKKRNFQDLLNILDSNLKKFLYNKRSITYS